MTLYIDNSTWNQQVSAIFIVYKYSFLVAYQLNFFIHYVGAYDSICEKTVLQKFGNILKFVHDILYPGIVSVCCKQMNFVSPMNMMFCWKDSTHLHLEFMMDFKQSYFEIIMSTGTIYNDR